MKGRELTNEKNGVVEKLTHKTKLICFYLSLLTK